MSIKKISLSFFHRDNEINAIVAQRLLWYYKNVKAESLLSIMVKVSSTYLNQTERRASTVVTHFSSKKHKKMLANTGLTGEPIATPSVRS